MGARLGCCCGLAASLILSACGAGGTDPLARIVGLEPPESPPAATMSSKEYSFAQQVMGLVNLERAGRGLAPLSWSETASTAAYDHAVDMDRRDFFDHTNPDGADPGERLVDAGVQATIWGENIAVGQSGPRTVMEDWMNSPGHRANILAPGYRSIGVGVHMANDGPWWVQDFVR